MKPPAFQLGGPHANGIEVSRCAMGVMYLGTSRSMIDWWPLMCRRSSH
jgi:hypothetical protein